MVLWWMSGWMQRCFWCFLIILKEYCLSLQDNNFTFRSQSFSTLLVKSKPSLKSYIFFCFPWCGIWCWKWFNSRRITSLKFTWKQIYKIFNLYFKCRSLLRNITYLDFMPTKHWIRFLEYIILLALVYSNYMIMFVGFGSQGCISDDGVSK